MLTDGQSTTERSAMRSCPRGGQQRNESRSTLSSKHVCMAAAASPLRPRQIGRADFCRTPPQWRPGRPPDHAHLSRPVVLLITVLLVYELWSHSGPLAAQVRLGIPVTARLGSGCRSVRRAAFHLRHRGHLRRRAADRRSSGPRRRDFSGGVGPSRLSNTLTFLIDLLAAVPSVIYGLLASSSWSR